MGPGGHVSVVLPSCQGQLRGAVGRPVARLHLDDTQQAKSPRKGGNLCHKYTGIGRTRERSGNGDQGSHPEGV